MNERSVFQKIGCGIILLDSQGRYSFLNRKAESMLGRSSSEVEGVAFGNAPWRLLDQEGRSFDLLAQVFEKGQSILGEQARVEVPGRPPRIFSLNATALRNDQEKITGAIIDFVDITRQIELKQEVEKMNQELHTREFHLRALIGSADEIVFEIDREGRYLNVLAENETLLKAPRENLIGRTIIEVLEPEAAMPILQALRTVAETGMPRTIEYCLSIQGSKKCFHGRIAPVNHFDPPTYSFFARDITKRVELEKKIKRANERLRTLLEKVELVALVISPEGEVLFGNDYFFKKMQWKREEIEGLNAFEVLLDPETREEVRQKWNEAMASDIEAFYNENEVLTKSGDRRLLAWNNIIVRENSSPKYGAAIAVDITDQRKGEEILRQHNKMKSEFISITAHEFRTPLTVIQGYSELLLNPEAYDRITPDRFKDFLQEIHDQSDALARIVDELFDLSRLESGLPLPLSFEKCSLENLIHKMVRNYQAHHPDKTFQVDVISPCPETVQIDSRKINQVLQNLLSNAVKYSGEGSLIRIMGKTVQDEYQVQVIDQGVGMSEEQISHIFEKFYRADSSDTAPGGLGLGMSIVKAIIEGHGGRIWVESAPKKGTTVSFTLPIQEQGGKS